jgi:transposase
MPKVKLVELTAEQRASLEQGAKYGTTPSFRLRCEAVLLKSQQRSSLEVATALGCCEMAVNNWVNRFLANGMAGLTTQQGRGRKAILQAKDFEAVRAAVIKNRQKVALAKVELESELGKSFSTLTLKRFLKKTVAASNDCGDG